MFEKEKERDVAPTRGQFPCPAFGPHGASLSAWVCLDFFLDLFSSFLFFLCPFSLGFSIQNALSLQHCQSGTPSHMRTDCHRSAGSKCQKKKFGTIYHFDMNLIRSRCAGHLLGVSHRSVSEKAEGTLQEMSNDGEASGFQVALFI